MKRPLLLIIGTLLLVLAPTIVIITATVVWIMPETYAGRARILLNGATATTLNNEVERIRSSRVLEHTIAKLDLRQSLGAKFKAPNGGGLTQQQAENFLRSQIVVTSQKGTTIMAITAHSDNRFEAAEWANQLARSYLEVCSPNGAQLLEAAALQSKPVRPKKAFTISIAGVVGLAFAAAGIVALLAAIRRGTVQRSSVPPLPVSNRSIH